MADNQDCKLFIGNITYNTRERELEEIFSKFGRLKEVRVAIDGSTGRSRGYAFITMESAQDAEQAVKEVSGTEVDGRAIRVEVATGERRAPAGGDRGGDRNGGGRGGDRDRGGRDFDRGGRDDRGARDDRGGRDRSRDRGGRDDRDFGRDRRDFGRDRDSGRDNGRDRDGGRDGGRGGDRDNGRRDRSPVVRRESRDAAPAERSRSRERGGDRAAVPAGGRAEGRRDRSRDR